MSRERAYAILAKYEVSEATISVKNSTDDKRFRDIARFGEAASFDWSDNRKGKAFHDDIVSAARTYFEALRGDDTTTPLYHYTKAPWHANVWTVFVAILFYTCCYAMFVHESWLAMFAAPYAGWLFAISYWHDALHFAFSPYWRVNKFAPYFFPFFMSPFMVRVFNYITPTYRYRYIDI